MSNPVRAAALRPFGTPSRRYWYAITALGIVVLAGVVAWIVQLVFGMGVAGYNDQAFWGIYIADVITFIGVSYGGAVVSAILRLTGADWRAPLTRLAEGTAVVTVLVGTALIIPHLGRPERVWELLTQPNFAAPVFWDFIAVMTYTAASLVFFLLPLVPDMAILHGEGPHRLGRFRAGLYRVLSRGWVGNPVQRRVLNRSLGLVSIMIIPLAVSVHSVLSWAFTLTNRPWWNESIWAPYFVVAALYSGVALVILVVASFRRGYHLEAFITPRHFVRLGMLLVTFSATYLYMTFADLLPGAYIGEPDTLAVFHELLLGRLAVWFWLFVIVGGVLPIVIMALPWTRNVWGIVTAAALVVPAMWLKRMLMVVAPATFDNMTGTFGDFRITWVGVAMTLAAAAAVPLLLMLLFRVVPLLSIDEIEEIDAANGTVRKAESGQKVDGNGRMARSVGIVVLLVGLMGGAAVGAAAPAQADTTSDTASIALTGVEATGLVRLTATLTDPDGRPMSQGDVEFLTTTSALGERLLPLGTIATDTTGVAVLTLGGDSDHLYRPSEAGPQEFFAHYTPSMGEQPITDSVTVNVTVGQSAYHPAEPKPFVTTGKVTVIAIFTIVAAIWLTLTVQVVKVRRVCTDAQLNQDTQGSEGGKVISG
ncbi:hypothetical protein E3T34_01305 [Cryobacterium sp. TMT1-62]|uniref:NrfD/PsrC family molybdoenzyme membrane anchor subunit n=1 Tax=unclassified Cryobacterium TaxID=2649013 RepID=UPI001069A9C0|nr:MULTISPECIES: NrfD/PsrC family molybdoenzyme membrane anchor subunit [unclassified Cryobacterium]TFC32994.1 hypothetical protein E3O28_15410 [Cryobacterium sp. TMT2-14]TFD36333.1 hypothetical protein E3T34_01305 [Cryobacterium sp. TMT1-62]